MLRAELPFPHIDPVAVPLPGPLDVRWYGLMYLVAFLVGHRILRGLARRGSLPLDADGVDRLVTAMVLGVLLGGRLGYALIYDFRGLVLHPANLARVWDGGMSFHGGLMGVALATAWFSYRSGVRYLVLGDALALAAPFGIFAVRMANFVNGELYGRVAPAGLPWGVRFPTDPVALRMMGYTGGGIHVREQLVRAAYRSGLWDAIRSQVPLRHPSQLYEGLAEGLLLGAALWALYAVWRRRGRGPATGLLSGTFLVGYGALRMFLELFRQPDAQFRGPGDPLGTVLGPLTMGQTLSALMVLAGLALGVIALRGKGDEASALDSDAPDPEVSRVI